MVEDQVDLTCAEPGPWRRCRKAVAVAATLICLSGCINTAYRDSVGQFGTLTKASVAVQDERLTALTADEQERIHAALAANHVDLRFSTDCTLLLLPPDPAATAPRAPCTLVDINNKPIERVPTYANIKALGQALSDYSDNLILLAADTTKDQEAFSTSVTGLATSLGNLDGAIRKATGAAPGTTGAKIGAIASIVAKAGGLFLAAERGRVLKKIVIAADPLVQEATGLLADVDDRLDLYDSAGLLKAATEAQVNASRLASNGASPDDLRAAQDVLFARVADYNARSGEQQRYLAIGVAHGKLAEAARSGSNVDFEAAINAVLDLASVTSSAIETLKQKEEE
jgi:hypothetical protein